ncbi:MAG: hypothetical protein NTW20_08510 [Rhodobacterales bacterium]|nr:hypothetical protein [Rhodobacterales bacterium]
MADPVRRDPENDADYAETLALYAQAFPEGMVFGKAWPAPWQDTVARGYVPKLVFGAFCGGLALFFSGEWGFLSAGWVQPVGMILFGFSLFGFLALDWMMPWRNDDNGY